MWKKIKFNVRLFFLYLFHGMKTADKIILSNDNDKDEEFGGIEEVQEQKSVYKDLLRGELTQEVIELRHEMYFSERESHKYKYIGNGIAAKQNTIFAYSGNIEMSDGLPLLLVQDNKEDIGTLDKMGIHVSVRKRDSVDLNDFKVEFDDKAKGDMRVKGEHRYTVHIERSFTPTYAIEKYISRVVVKAKDDEGNVLVDIYVPKYNKQFDNVHKMFMRQMEKIYSGEVRNQIIEFDELGFTTLGAYGVDDYVTFIFNEFTLDNVLIHDGSYVLRYSAKILKRSDILDEVYDEATAKKCENHERREGGRIMGADVVSAKLEQMNHEEFDYEKAKDIVGKIGKKK